MKQLIKKILPKKARFILREFYNKALIKKRAQKLNYEGSSPDVLQCQVAYNKFGGYCVPLSSYYRPAAQAILNGEVWEPETISLLAKFAKIGGGDIVHAGTYFGDFLPALSQACLPGAQVWAFEPNPENYRCALMTKNINELENVHLMNSGLGEKSGFMSMEVVDTQGKALGGASKLILDSQSNLIKTTQVKIVTIDETVPLERKVSVIQLDVEGFEKWALSGAHKTILKWKPILILETLPTEDWLKANIMNIGYKIIAHVPGNIILGCD